MLITAAEQSYIWLLYMASGRKEKESWGRDATTPAADLEQTKKTGQGVDLLKKMQHFLQVVHNHIVLNLILHSANSSCPLVIFRIIKHILCTSIRMKTFLTTFLRIDNA